MKYPLLATLRKTAHEIRLVIRAELRNIFHDEGVVLIMVFAPIIYATIYSMAYSTEVLRDVPIGVIDNSRTSSSRELISMLNAGPDTVVAYEPTDIEEAKRLFFERKIYGIIYIPDNYERDLLGGEQATVAIYLDASYMLMYRQVFQELAASISTSNAMVEFHRLIAKGANIPQAATITQPIIYQSHTLFNPYLGYGTFVMPPVLILILQQTLLVGIGMISGTQREQKEYRHLSSPPDLRLRISSLIIGKTAVYLSIYAVIVFYLLHLHYRLFHYPMRGETGVLLIFITLYLLACIFLGISLSTLFRRRETSLMLLLWTSIPLLMLSGVSYPHEAMPKSMQYLANIFPSTFGTQGFVKIATEGASLYEVINEIKALIILDIIYLCASIIGISAIHQRDTKSAHK